MARLIRLLGGALLAFTVCVHSQEPTGVDHALPNPGSLAGDWWKYFENSGDELPERVALFKAQIQPTEVSVASPDDIDEIGHSLDTFVAIQQRPEPSAVETPVAAEHYTLAEVLDLVGQLRDLQLEEGLEREEIASYDKAVRQARKDLDDLRAKYLALDDLDPSKRARGFEIVRDRLRLVLAQDELSLLRARLERKEQQMNWLRGILDTASKRLIASRGDVESYKQQYERAAADVSRLNSEATAYRLRGSGASVTPDPDLARLHRLKLIEFYARTATAEIEQSETLVALAITKLLRNGSEDKNHDSVREALQELDHRLKETDELRQTWRRVTDSQRSTAEAQLSILQGQDAVLAEIHRARIQQADVTLQAIAELRERSAKSQILVEVAKERLGQSEGWLLSWLGALQQDLGNVWNMVTELATGSLFKINETPVTLLGLVRVLVILAIAWWVSKIVRHGLDRVAQRQEAMNRASLYTIGRLFHYAILTIGIFVGLSSIGLDFTKLALFVSALGVGLGFGLQAIFSNFVAGLIILLEKSLKVGDFVELESGVNGEVREINIRSTLISTNDNIDILVPNSEFVNGRVTNWTLREAYRRLRVPFGVAYGTDKDLVKKAALEAAAAVPFTLTGSASRRPQVWLVQFGDSSLNFELVVWLKPEAVLRPGTVHAAYTWELDTVLHKYGIEIPFPQRDLHLRSGFNPISASSGPIDDDQDRSAKDHSASTTV